MPANLWTVNTTTSIALDTDVWVKWADIASATTTDIWAATWNFVDITWTTTITSFGTIQAWTQRILQFDWILILTNNGTSLILPTGANITTAAWDTCNMISLWSGNWLCTDYQRADWTALASAWGWVSEIFDTRPNSSLGLTTTIATIQFDNEQIDTGWNFNTWTFTYTAPSAWEYMIYFSLSMFSMTDQDRIRVELAVNWTTRMGIEADVSGDLFHIWATKNLTLWANDTIIIRARNATASRGTVNSGTSCAFGWYKLN